MTTDRESLLAALRCLVRGHAWEFGLPSGHSFCQRCKRYDDHPAIKRQDRVRHALALWSPIGISVKRRDLNARVGLPRFATLSARLHFGLDRTGELPGLNVTLHIWRLRVWAGIGSGWQDEDGDDRSFCGLNVAFTTYGLRWIGCWFGHKPTASKYIGGHVYCDRCDVSLELADADPRKVAA